MAATVKARDFLHAAEKKGFDVKRAGDHIQFYLVREDGTINHAVHTKISHGATDISASNLSKMKRQLGFSTMEELQKYIACTLSLEDYRIILQKQGLI
ncbi:MAG TPA: hypothetical protein O0X70_07210 [Methanocorpusculum sp.]|nr:hypothetical protein [Methanocorpusculum sp.]